MNSEILSIDPGWLIDGRGDAVQAKIKLDIQKIVQCATYNGALLLGLLQVGQLKTNMQATLIAVEDALSQLQEGLNRIKLILFKGKIINQDGCELKLK
jgi:adenine deaminase